MSRKILSVATLGLVKPKKKAAPAEAAPAQQPKGPVITQLGGQPAPQRPAQRRRYMGQVGTVLSDKLGG